MGCTVDQTPTTTTVTGPKTLLPIPSIDMETMTDAFMTATVLAAVARNPNNEYDNTTRITGIANQRVKECDRIAAMIEQLARLGVKASELPDGIQIHGVDRNTLNNILPSGIKCYDDHRIAMSFSVLACAYPHTASGPIITEKKCVEKTWPAWWDTIQNTLGVKTVGIDLELHHEEKSAITSGHSIDTEKSIVLIGMRGAGKTHMAKAGALILDREFIDMDDYLEYVAKCSIPEYIKANSWEAFRALEAECLKNVLKEKSTGAVISCGGGIVEGEHNRSLLSSWNGLVVHIKRNIDQIEAYLNIDKTRPMYGEDMKSVWKRRESWYLECSNSEFVVLSPSPNENESVHYQKVEADFARFLHFHLSKNRFSLPKLDSLSFFVSLTMPNISSAASIIQEISTGADALELRVDLLENLDSDFIGEQVALLRSLSTLPIVFTVRTKQQGGKFPNEKHSEMVQLLLSGLRWGCEYVDVEFTSPLDRFESIINTKRNSQIIASYHDTLGVDTWTADGSMIKKYSELYNYCDIIKLIGHASMFGDNFALYRFRTEIIQSLGLPEKPLIALLMGAEGQLSRSLNTFLTPVTHPALSVAAAPGQVSIADIHKVRNGIGMLPGRSFCLFGSPISQSMSPVLHNTGFSSLGLPFSYSLEETSAIEDVKKAMTSKSGASVTIPLKVDVLKSGMCDFVDPAAQAIGAINTLAKGSDGKISGYNTDWIGIQRSILRHLPSNALAYGVVLGAGGTSRAALYALSKIPQVQKVKVWNRTHSKAVELATEFNATAVQDLTQVLRQPQNKMMKRGPIVFIIVGTIPASAQSDLPLKEMYQQASNDYGFGIVVDMAYRPRETPLLLSSQQLEKSWNRVEGIEVLLEQGFEQFKIWTGIKAPQSLIRQRVMEKY